MAMQLNRSHLAPRLMGNASLYTNNTSQCLVDLLHAGVGLLNSRGELLYGNPYLLALLEGSSVPKSGKKIFLGRVVDRAQLHKIYRHLEIHDSWRGMIQQSGGYFEVEVVKSGIQIVATGDGAERAQYIIQAFENSEYLKQQQELSEARKYVEKSGKGKDDALSQMGHELRTPLNAVLGFAQLLHTDDGLNDEQKDYANEIISASGYLLNLINQILNVSKTDHEYGEVKLISESINIDALVTECLALVSPLALKAKVTMSLKESNAALSQDRVHLKQVILNLLSNAIKYNIDGGRVVVTSFYTLNTLRIEVQDTGRGIPTRLLNTIFSPFERLGIKDEQIEGTGIGLMITRRLVNLMNGRINVISEPGCGSVFSLDFALEESALQLMTRVPMAVARNVYWIGDVSSSQEFASRLTLLRPELSFHRFGDIEEALGAIRSSGAELILISMGKLMRLEHESSAEEKILLKRIPLIAVVTKSLILKTAGSTEFPVVAQLSLPFNAIEYMEILDKQLYSK